MKFKKIWKKFYQKLTIKITRSAFFIYSGLFKSNVRTCRYEPTCSDYAQQALIKYGLVTGATKSIVRLLSCQPFSKRAIIDPLI